MSKKLLLVIVVGINIILGYFLYSQLFSSPSQDSRPKTQVSENIQPTSKPFSKKKTLFVPYWNVMNDTDDMGQYDRLLYFGVTPTRSGLNTSDEGYKNMSKFASYKAVNKDKYLVVRMLDTDLNTSIIQNQKTWDSIVSESIQAAKDNGFNGIVLDLEMSVLPFSDVQQNITQFTQYFSSHAKASSLYFAITAYGDTFYRKRPYDIQTLSGVVDEVMVMAYDFSKSHGEPGPNFPLFGKDKYGYDFQQMLTDFSVVPPEKLTIIFGMYGYDWVVDESKKPLRAAKSLSLLDIKKNFIETCEWKDCVVFPDKIAGETEVNYIDKSLFYHIVWFEDEQSVAAKIKLLEEKGIGSVAYWVHGYF